MIREVVMQKEILNGLYILSDNGDIYSAKRKKDKPLKVYIRRYEDQSPYKSVILYDDSQHWFKVHELVAQYYVPNPDNQPDVIPKDGNYLNTNCDNLVWGKREKIIERQRGNKCLRCGVDVNGHKSEYCHKCKRLNRIDQAIERGDLRLIELNMSEYELFTLIRDNMSLQCIGDKYHTSTATVKRLIHSLSNQSIKNFLEYSQRVIDKISETDIVCIRCGNKINRSSKDSMCPKCREYEKREKRIKESKIQIKTDLEKKIFEMYSRGDAIVDIARAMGCSRSTIHATINKVFQ